MKSYIRMLAFLKPYLWPHFTLAIICMLIYGVTGGAIPFLTKRIFDDVFSRKDQNVLAFLPFMIIGVFALRGFVSFGQDYLMSYVSGRVVTDIRNRLNSRMLDLSLSFFQRHPSGTLISRMTNDVGLISYTLMGPVVSLPKNTTSLVALAVAAFVMDPLLGLVAFVVFPASVLPVMRLGKKIKKLTRKAQVTVAAFTALMQETIQGARIVRAFGAEQYERDRFEKENERLFKLGIKASRTQAVITPAMELLAAFAIGGIVWYGGHSVIGGARTQGQFMAFMAAMFLMYQPFKKLAATSATVQQGTVAAERIFEILDEPSELAEKANAVQAPRFSRALEFHDVSFRYEEKFVLKNVDLEIKAGEMVALVGVSGVGKSTLADLIPRFYDPTAGKITMDGIDIRQVTLRSLRSQIGVVTQHTFLFNDTVRNNIAYGDWSKDMAHVVAAAKAAYAHDFIMSMPAGYDTVIGEMGFKLSGGERQRLAIARALLKDPPILVLDEATSSLDSESERSVQDALERLMVGRTALVIAHRLSTVHRADRIVVLVDGAIAEEGTHEELLAQKREYHKLCSLQFLVGEESKLKGSRLDALDNRDLTGT